MTDAQTLLQTLYGKRLTVRPRHAPSKDELKETLGAMCGMYFTSVYKNEGRLKDCSIFGVFDAFRRVQ